MQSAWNPDTRRSKDADALFRREVAEHTYDHPIPIDDFLSAAFPRVAGAKNLDLEGKRQAQALRPFFENFIYAVQAPGTERQAKDAKDARFFELVRMILAWRYSGIRILPMEGKKVTRRRVIFSGEDYTPQPLANAIPASAQRTSVPPSSS